MRPTRKRFALVAKAGALTAAAAAAAAMLAPPAAHAAASSTVVRHTVWVGGCEAILYSNSAEQASAGVYMSQSADSSSYGCMGWLERQNSSGSAWYTVSGYHHADRPGTSAYTGWYDDTAPKQASACVEQSFYSGDARAACTAGW